MALPLVIRMGVSVRAESKAAPLKAARHIWKEAAHTFAAKSFSKELWMLLRSQTRIYDLAKGSSLGNRDAAEATDTPVAMLVGFKVCVSQICCSNES